MKVRIRVYTEPDRKNERKRKRKRNKGKIHLRPTRSGCLPLYAANGLPPAPTTLAPLPKESINEACEREPGEGDDGENENESDWESDLDEEEEGTV
jgi:hypothetical protein